MPNMSTTVEPNSKIVVGGGIAGLLSSILLKTNNPTQAVFLIEAQSQCGGLLRSIKSPEGYEFDYGTHILGQTGIEALDAILFEKVEPQHWYELQQLKPGNVFNGYFHQYSQLPYVKALPPATLEKATYELLSADFEQADDSTNLDQYCRSVYGDTFTEVVFEPLLNKLFGVGLTQLDKSAHKLFGYERLIIGHARMMRELKKNPHFDRILAFESYDEGVSSSLNYYPKNGKGIGLWVDNLVQQALDLGVEILTDTTIKQIDTDGNQVTAIHTPEQQLNCDQLIWTAPLFPLIKLTSLPFTPQYRPTLRSVCLVHFVFDRKFLTHNFHVYCNEPQMKSFRITLYANIAANNEVNGAYRCSVEILLDDEIDNIQEVILAELITMGVVDAQAKVLYRAKDLLNNGFPVYTNQFVNELHRQVDCVSNGLENVTLLGKASANNFFMNDVLVEVFNRLGDKP
ncbi:MAG: protoporphyrinogen oxidase [Phenylobacterium sp.]|jgi:protoporphyrinogen oxidase